MRIMKKYYKVGLSIILSLVIMFALSVFRFGKKENSLNDASVRAISLEQMTNKEHTELILNKFNSYVALNTDTSIGFEGDMSASIGEILGFDSLAYQDETVMKKISTKYDYTTNNFYMNISYYSGEILLETTDVQVEPLYDEQRDDGYIIYNDVRYYFTESFNVNGLDECVAGVDDVVVVGVGSVIVCGIIITLVVAPPSVHQEIIKTVTYVYETAVQAVQSFWGWFSNWITKIFTRTVSVESSTVVLSKTPAIEISKVKYETKEITKEERQKLPKSSYYIAFADTTNDSFYISLLAISIPQAIAIMKAPTSVKCIGNENYEMLTSVFTATEYAAWTVMDLAEYNSRTPMGSPEYENGLYHYHSAATKLIKTSKFPNGEYYSPHLFFAYRM